MMYDAVILPVAQEDIRDAVHWYETVREGLGLKFTAQIRKKIILIKTHPKAFAIRYRQMRTAVLSNFPYMIHYQVDDENQQIIVHAVFHTSRNPDIWTSR